MCLPDHGRSRLDVCLNIRGCWIGPQALHHCMSSALLPGSKHPCPTSIVVLMHDGYGSRKVQGAIEHQLQPKVKTEASYAHVCSLTNGALHVHSAILAWIHQADTHGLAPPHTMPAIWLDCTERMLTYLFPLLRGEFEHMAQLQGSSQQARTGSQFAS